MSFKSDHIQATQDLTVNGSTYFYGNIILDGSSYETHAEQIYTTKDFIVMRDGAISALADGSISGLQVMIPNGANNLILGAGNDAVMRVGWNPGTLVALAGREDSPSNGYYAYWDDSSSIFKTKNLQGNIDASLTLYVKKAGDTMTGKYIQTGTNSSEDTAYDAITLNISGGVDNYHTGGIRISGNFYHYARIEAIHPNSYGSWDNRIAISGMNGDGGALIERLSIKNNGNVGIGTTAPQELLHVSGSGATIRAEIEATDGNASGLKLTNTEGSFAWYTNQGDFYIYDFTSATQPIYIESSGNVGIGTTAPDNLLHVNSTADGVKALVQTYNSTNGYYTGIAFKVVADPGSDFKKGGIFFERVGSYGVGKLHLANNITGDGTDATLGDARLTINEDGYIGIGTTNPDSLFHVNGGDIILNDSTGSLSPDINLLTDDSSYIARMVNAGNSFGRLELYYDSSLKIQLSAAENSYILNNNVGIGTAAPGAKLEISLDNELGGGHLYITNPNTAFTGKISDITFRIADSVGTIKPAAYIQAIPHNVNLTTGAGLAFWTRKLDVTPTEAMRIDNVGNVGIGTTSPDKLLEISKSLGATLRLTNPDTSQPDGTFVGGIEFYDYDADGPKVDAFIKGITRTTYGQYGALTFGVSKTANTDAVEAMRIDYTGDVGIGTTAPNRPLHLYRDDTTETSQMRIDQDGTGDSVLEFSLTSARNYLMGIDNSDSNKFKIATGGTTLATGSMFEISTTGVVAITNLASGSLTSVSGVITSSSDERLKIADGSISNALDKVMNLEPRYFYWDASSGLDSSTRQLGFFAQEVNAALGEEVANTPEEGKYGGFYDRGVIAMLTKAIQELKAQNDSLMARIEILENN